MAHPKPLLMPWLQEQINSSKYPGVQWTNPEKTEFSIPWKHGLRHDGSDTDILMFKAWAEVSGSGRAHGDPSVWKRNFRSALRAKGFTMVYDNKNDNANPHKVYRWPEKSAASGDKSCAGSQELDDSEMLEDCGLSTPDSHMVPCLEDLYLSEAAVFTDVPDCQDIVQACLRGLNISLEAEGTAGFEPPPEQQQLQHQIVIGACPLPGQQQYPVPFEGAAGEAGLPEQPAHPIEAAGGGADDGQVAAQFLETMQRTRDGDSFRTQFRITVYYRGVAVSEQTVENESGFRLVYRPELVGSVVDPDSGLSLVSLPRPTGMVDQTQANLTGRILERLGDGVEVGMSGGAVYGQRRGEIKAFWSFSNFDSSNQPQEVPKLHPQPLYLFRDFLQGIKDFIAGKGSPPFSLFFCLGEKWPDPDSRPWVKKLITVKVVLTSLEILKNMAVGGGASSLQSVELQLSLDEMMDLF